MHLSGKFSLNPLLLITKVLIDDTEENLRYITQSDTDFNKRLAFFADSLSTYDQELSLKTQETSNESALEYALQKLFKPKSYIDSFIWKVGYLMKKYELTMKPTMDTFKRREDNEIVLDLPFPAHECWMMSATHVGASGFKDESENWVKSSVDFSPTLFQNWGVSFDYLNSEGHVHTAHSGRVTKLSGCSMEVQDLHSEYSTYYSHINVADDIAEHDTVTRGQLIGNISLYPDQSNCNCDWANSLYECSSGPHLHLEIRKDGYPVSLDNRMISNYRIRAGKFSHDMGCSDPESCTGKKAASCATTFTDVNTNTVYCPTVKGQNIGKNYILTRIICSNKIVITMIRIIAYTRSLNFQAEDIATDQIGINGYLEILFLIFNKGNA